MQSRSKIIEQIHLRAQTAVRLYKKCEIDLIEILEEAETFRVHISLGYSSLFNYATAGLDLSEEVAYTFINVARKAREIPALKTKIREGTISLSKARRITAVLTKENQKHWLQVAETTAKRPLEKLVAAENPRAAVVEKATYVSSNLLQLQLGVSETLMLRLRRAQDVLSQRKRRPLSLEETLSAMTDQFLERNDPVAKAKRQEAKGKLLCVPKSALDQERTSNDKAPTAQGKGLRQNNKVETEEQISRDEGTKNITTTDNKSAENHESKLCPGTVNKSSNHVNATRNWRAGRASRREPVPAAIRHKLQLKYNGQCSHKDGNGKRCGERRFLDLHHIVPVSMGGRNEIDNLELLCKSHHRHRHES